MSTPMTARMRLIQAWGSGLVVGLVVGFICGPALGFLCGLALGQLLLAGLSWKQLWPLSSTETEREVAREDLDSRLQEKLVVGIALMALAGNLLVLGTHSNMRAMSAIAMLAGVFFSWANIQMMYAAQYAEIYYTDSPGGIDWNDDGYRPSYQDFFYFSYNLGMTYQVSDTSVSSPKIRAISLRHCLLSWFFGLTILASAINLVLSIASGN